MVPSATLYRSTHGVEHSCDVASTVELAVILTHIPLRRLVQLLTGHQVHGKALVQFVSLT